MIKHLLVLVLAAMLAACAGSPSNNYYLLTPSDFSSPTGKAPSVGVGPVTVPRYLSRDQLVFNNQGNVLQVTGSDKWAEPLEDGIARVLGLNLASLLNTQDVRLFPWHPKRAPDYGVKIGLLGLNANDEEASLTAEWLVFRPNDATPIMRRISRLELALDSGPVQADQLAPAYSNLLAQLSELIAAAISEHMPEAGTPAP